MYARCVPAKKKNLFCTYVTNEKRNARRSLPAIARKFGRANASSTTEKIHTHTHTDTQIHVIRKKIGPVVIDRSIDRKSARVIKLRRKEN